MRRGIHCGIERSEVDDRVVTPHRAFKSLEVHDVDRPVRLMRAAVDSVDYHHIVVGIEHRHDVAPQHSVSAGNHDALHFQLSGFV